MAIVRISLVRPFPGQKARVERILDNMADHFSQQKGYVMGCRFEARDDPEQLGRMSIWESHSDADHAAILTHTEALMSELHRLIEPGHLERIYEIKGSPKNLPKIKGS